jgi:hypothetical protein
MATASASRADKGSSLKLPRLPRALAARPPRGRLRGLGQGNGEGERTPAARPANPEREPA